MSDKNETTNMKNLQLSLKKKWFDLTASGEKTEDYREITPRWCNIFLLYNEARENIKWWNRMQNYHGCFFRKAIERDIENGIISFNSFGLNIMTLGYPKSTNTSRILKLKHAGIHIGEGKPELGAEAGKLYFVIKHGERLQ